MMNVIYCVVGVLMFGLVFGDFHVNSEINKTNTIINEDAINWTYECTLQVCNRRHLKPNEAPVSFETCMQNCLFPSLWPLPKSVTFTNQSLSTFTKNLISLNITSPSNVKNDIKKAFNLFMDQLPDKTTLLIQDLNVTNVFIKINITKDEIKPTLNSNESYYLLITKKENQVITDIVSETYFGARHALETLSQLIMIDTFSGKLQVYHDIEIQDKPAFPHRGLMVDTARNFFPINDLLKVLDGMAANKLNVFHLHLTDSESFPIVLPSNPWMAKYGAYSPEKMYQPEDIKGLIEYARIRGIRVILEIDSPSHVNEGWRKANTNTNKVVMCGEEEVTNGHLNPDNPKTFELLKSVYSDLLELGTDNETFHVGGDEVNLTCYQETKTAKKFHNIFDFWVDLNHKIFQTVTQAFNNQPPKNLVIWSNDLTSHYMKDLVYTKDLVVQYWYGQLDPILENGNKIIFSTVGHWYLDCGFGPWRPNENQGSCDTFTHWKVFYQYRPWESYSRYTHQFLGGEACLWSEEVDMNSLETRIWPRTAAFAERMWSDLSKYNIQDVVMRLSIQRDRLIQRGLKAAAIWPEWCTKHPGKC